MQQQLIIGTLLHGGTYKIEKILGQGSFGITYLAEHTNLGKKVAIKEFFMKELNSRGEDGSITGMSDSSLSQNYCQKFKKEAINLSRLDHPNIVRVTDSFSENGTFYYVMDFIEGQNLNDYIKSHYIDEAEAVSIIKSVADALIYMHEENHMLHLDLKPGNVMRRESDGHVFLIDFGLSKHYSTDGQPETSTTIGLGTAGYAPIEQGNQAKNGEFRPTIDVYALGATFYKLLTRETPPPASDLVSDDELLESKLREKGVSDNLIKVVTEAMCPNVRRRTQSIKEFKGNLDCIKSETQATINVTSDDTIAGTGKEETIVTSAEDFKKAGNVSYSTYDNDNNEQDESQEEIVEYEYEEEPSFIEKYWKYGVAVAVVLLGIYFCSNWNSSPSSLQSDDVVDTQGNQTATASPVQSSNSSSQQTQNVTSYPTANEKLSTVSVESRKVFTVVEQMPSFPGGDAALMSYLANNIHYPTVAAENGVQGRVVVGFVVERDGSITDVRILRGVDPSLDREAMRVVKSMPRWTPGKQNGSAVRVKYQVPVAFRLQ